MRILLIEDDQVLCDTLKRGLGEIGYVVESAHDGETGIYYARNAEYDLIILDIMLPDKSGIEVCQVLRASAISTPILMLTAKNTLKDKVKGLNAGADDYLCKPFEFDELEARLRSLQRRLGPQRSPVIENLGISLNTVTHEVKADGKPVALTATEYRILEYFMMNPNQVITREMIEGHIWAIENTHQSNAIDVFIRKLRRKLGCNARTGPIRTIYGEGYKLAP